MEGIKKYFNITPRQAEIILHLVSGKTNSEIAKALEVAETTIKGHITNIYDKLGISNKIELQNLLITFNAAAISSE